MAYDMGKKFLIGKLVRVIIWILGGVFGANAIESEPTARTIAEGILSLAGVIATFAWSMKNDKALLHTEPPKK